jgi:hypothetical protein
METPKELETWVGSLTRDFMISAIVQCEIETNSGENDWYLRSVLIDGCTGYSKYEDSELREAIGSMIHEDETPEENKRYIEGLAERGKQE